MPFQTATTWVQSSPYMDIAAGGKWECGANKSWGQFPSSTWNQDAAAPPPCTQDRMAVRNSIRDSWKGGCCNGEQYLTQPSWPYSYRGARGYGATVQGERLKSGTHMEPSSLNDDAWNEKYTFANLAMLGTMPLFD